ncbi:TPA: type IV secretion system protein VirB10 [Campylobacter jejuni]|nr:TrbI/VirB10 family protein [Campylobacter jejuni]EGS0795695.1 TrbI/VirB10 family protein [Campylobacter coli]EDP7298775.1 type IV secretion system protein VirB10 [Campylobacter jejuni]HDZ4368574.1 type IV secretion system protein VirB10 [Campylobacter jejuni]HDZ4376992.1 type IV secretion system protein VirB10 [Campylobacter jejuni]
MSNNEKQELKDMDLQSELQTQSVNVKKIQIYVFFIACVFILLLFGYIFAKSFISSSDEAANSNIKETNKDIASSVKLRDFILPKEEPIQEETKSFEDLLKSREQEESVKVAPKENPFEVISKPLQPRIVKGVGMVVVSNSSSENSSYEQENSSQGGYSNNIFNSESNQLSNGGNSNEFVGDVFTPTSASVSQFDPNLLLSKGTYIGCSLKTRLVSTIKGGIACIVSNNVYSSNGNVLLIEKGSTITGSFSSGQLNDGMDRLFVIWQEIRTPNNIIIPVYSGATDELGASGIQGWVDHHYMKRFGSAILLSIIDDSLNILANQVINKKENSVDYTENSRETSREIANTALEKMINIQPTLYKNHGDLVGVYVNRDIDFSKVYQLKRRGF